MTPVHGVVPVGGNAEIRVSLTPEAILKFDTRVQVAIKGSKVIELRMGGTVEAPEVDIDTVSCCTGIQSSVSVCMCACMCACMCGTHMCTSVCVFVCVRVCMCVCVFACLRAFMCACVCVCFMMKLWVYVHVYFLFIYY